MADILITLKSIEDALRHAEIVLTDMEVGVAQADVVLSGSSADDAIRNLGIGVELSDIGNTIAEQSRAAFGTIEAFDTDLAAFSVEIRSHTDSIETQLTELEHHVVGSVELLTTEIAAFIEGTEHISQAIGEALAQHASTFEHLLDEHLLGATSALVEANHKIESAIQSATGGTTKFVQSVDESIGKLVSGLEQIERVIEPIRPVLTLLEAVA
jgi:hypothetical protein